MTTIATAQGALFGVDERLPQGLRFEAAIVTPAEERTLIGIASGLPLRSAKFRDYTARRRVHVFGARPDREPSPDGAWPIEALPLPLRTLRDRLAAWAGVDAGDFVHVLVSEYRPGTPLGWHRDAPAYELIVGVSLAGPARLRLRPWQPGRGTAGSAGDGAIALDLAPRSAYLMRDEARWTWQHSVPPVPALRYSVTMRTPRRGARVAGG